MLNREGQKSNEELLTPPQSTWGESMRNNFKITIEVSGVYIREGTMMSLQRQIEEMIISIAKGGRIRYSLE